MEEREADSCAIGMSEQNPDSYEQSGQSDNAKDPTSDRDSDGDEHYKFQQEFATMTEKLHQSERLMKPLLGNLQSTRAFTETPVQAILTTMFEGNSSSVRESCPFS